jgi:hypothetical protein
MILLSYSTQLLGKNLKIGKEGFFHYFLIHYSCSLHVGAIYVYI